MNDLLVPLACVFLLLASVLIMVLLTRSIRRYVRQLGWRAYHDGLWVNPEWGKDLTSGWYAARRGEPLP
jgi:hypothetical protein